MDRRTFQRIKRGKSKPDARIDLHGMTVAVAHPALTSFVLKSHAAGHRLLLVITGKGRGGEDDDPVPVRRGILRQQVPHWLTIPPLASVVLQVEPAHDRHGGSGAFYVYLRRR
jgi:DNA-nicking Smr family endonuclease